jgi:hypothetical protein
VNRALLGRATSVFLANRDVRAILRRDGHIWLDPENYFSMPPDLLSLILPLQMEDTAQVLIPGITCGAAARHQLQRLVIFNRNRWSPSPGPRTPRIAALAIAHRRP